MVLLLLTGTAYEYAVLLVALPRNRMLYYLPSIRGNTECSCCRVADGRNRDTETGAPGGKGGPSGSPTTKQAEDILRVRNNAPAATSRSADAAAPSIASSAGYRMMVLMLTTCCYRCIRVSTSTRTCLRACGALTILLSVLVRLFGERRLGTEYNWE